MTALGRRTFLLMIPLNVLLVLWVWFGRVAFGVMGWFLLVLIPVALILFLALLATSILAFTQEGRPRALTRLQSVAQLVTWVGMFLTGAFLPDFGDTDDSYISLLTQVFGRSDALLGLSWTITLVSAAVTVAAYAVLLASLIIARRSAPSPRPQGASSQTGP